jgi:hypothetical protein
LYLGTVQANQRELPSRILLNHQLSSQKKTSVITNKHLEYTSKCTAAKLGFEIEMLALAHEMAQTCSALPSLYLGMGF